MLFNALDVGGNFSALLRTVDLCVEKANKILALPTMKIAGKEITPKTHDIVANNIDFAYDKKKMSFTTRRRL